MKTILYLKPEDFVFPASLSLGQRLCRESESAIYDEIFLEVNEGHAIKLRPGQFTITDDLVARATELCKDKDSLTTSYLQRKLLIGYELADKLRLEMISSGLTK
ncbi:hypothetical protein LEP1GSC202_0441 [Leptospira yanagawae serovar Saopaulo str. Sao Paulo = ATCC 700523]|uniref:Uncharacterized protein n=1 Tax=Leptospira yanagawae serovar Saopaulo str. Sao Paulo = ATCC 700523 TaxID=1249483 RepID=A0A5E8HGY0_9LEPT|nr:hypothetical protein [Leptospira yanagawae]EOQ90751.1 hypothetical protein LEP1GSC202_0441 [Leptospira yanagawae serovar Saopaulo str. Sao Paulo = ATCC 700523]